MDRKALVGLLSGVSLVIATLIGVAVLNMPAEGAATTARTEPGPCAAGRKSAEQGYAVVRMDGACPAK